MVMVPSASLAAVESNIAEPLIKEVNDRNEQLAEASQKNAVL
jgi:hypothetical protein